MSRTPMHHTTLVALLAALLIAAVAAAGAITEPAAAAGVRRASGISSLDINLCQPTCVASRMRTFRHSTIELSAARRTAVGDLFTGVRLTYTDAGRRHTVTAYTRT